MLELRTGEPPCYDFAVAAAVLTVMGALIFNRIQLEYSVLLLLLAACVVACDRWVRRKRNTFVRLRVTQDFSVALCDQQKREYPSEIAGPCWVSSRMIIIPLKTGHSRRMRIVVVARRNDPDAFRRFSIICRFGFAVTDSERHNVLQLNPKGIIK